MSAAKAQHLEDDIDKLRRDQAALAAQRHALEEEEHKLTCLSEELRKKAEKGDL